MPETLPFVLNTNIALKQHIWTSVLHHSRKTVDLGQRKKKERKKVQDQDGGYRVIMHKYSIKIQYGISVRLGGESGRASSVWGKGFEMLGSG